MTSRRPDPGDLVYKLSGKELKKTTPIAEWVNIPTVYDNDLRRNLPRVPRGRLSHSDDRDTGTGLPEFPETPLFRFNREIRTVKAFDISMIYRSLLLLSGEAKQRFEEIDPEAFEFIRVDVQLVTGEPGPEHWLADVVRVVDALDRDRSDLIYSSVASRERFLLNAAPANNVFRREALDDLVFFRQLYLPVGVYCTYRGRAAILEAPPLEGELVLPAGVIGG
jgi:hypothetical protein